MLLALHLLALGVGTIVFMGMVLLHRRARRLQRTANSDIRTLPPGRAPGSVPTVWLAIRSTNLKAVLAALGLNYPVSCSWQEGITGERELFIGPPVEGWIIITGSRLPQPGRDVDACFLFLVHLSRKLGHVQFFVADPVRHQHAWARAQNGIVTRAYAWANGAVWNQGAKTLAEIELNVKCFKYGEDPEMDNRTVEEIAATNVEKVPALAARWSFDPAAVHGDWQIPADGVAGNVYRLRQD